MVALVGQDILSYHQSDGLGIGPLNPRFREGVGLDDIEVQLYDSSKPHAVPVLNPVRYGRVCWALTETIPSGVWQRYSNSVSNWTVCMERKRLGGWHIPASLPLVVDVGRDKPLYPLPALIHASPEPNFQSWWS